MPFQVYIVTGVLVLAALLFSVYASIKVRSTFSRFSGERPASGMTGYDAARKVLDENGLYGVRIERVSGSMTDHFDPRANVIRLSETVYDVSSMAAVGVAAHEAGHAVQYARHYIPLRLRNAIIPITNIGARLSTPLVLLGLLLSIIGSQFILVAYAGVVCFGLSVLFQLLTLPTEFNASRRALKAVSAYGVLTPEETASTRKVLSAAAMTYVAAMLVAFTQLLRLLAIVASRDRRR